jgi:hypothetical protein
MGNISNSSNVTSIVSSKKGPWRRPGRVTAKNKELSNLCSNTQTAFYISIKLLLIMSKQLKSPERLKFATHELIFKL